MEAAAREAGLRFTDHLYESIERSQNGAALRGWDRTKDFGEFGLTRCRHVFSGLLTVTGEMHVHDSRIGLVAAAFDPTSALQQGDDAAHGALLEAQSRRKPVLRKPRFAGKFEQGVSFRDGHGLAARGLIRPVKTEGPDEPEHRLLESCRLLERPGRVYSSVPQRFDYRTIS